HEHVVADDDVAGREKQSTRREVFVDSEKVTELGDYTTSRTKPDDLVSLVCTHPEPTGPVECQPVGTIDALGESGDRFGVGGHVHSQDAIVTGVGDEEGVVIAAEREPVWPGRGECSRGRRPVRLAVG